MQTELKDRVLTGRVLSRLIVPGKGAYKATLRRGFFNVEFYPTNGGTWSLVASVSAGSCDAQGRRIPNPNAHMEIAAKVRMHAAVNGYELAE